MRPAVSGFVSLSATNREYTGWLKDRVLTPARKLSLVVTFVPSESARPDQIADLIKELYILHIYIYIFFFSFSLAHLSTCFIAIRYNETKMLHIATFA